MALQADFARNSKVAIGLIVTTALVAGGVIGHFLVRPDEKPQSALTGYQANDRGHRTKESDNYTQQLNTYNKRNAESAANNEQTYLSVVSQKPAPVPDKKPEPVAQAFVAPPVRQQEPTQQDQQASQRQAAQTQALLNAWAPVGHSTATVATDGDNYVKSVAARYTDDIKDKSSANAPQKIVSDYALIPATLLTDIDTDENSMVTALIPNGQYAGAKVFAMGYRRLNETVDMTFTAMLWNGKSYKITAKAVDPGTNRTALSGDVNHRYFERILLPAIASGIGQVGQLYKQASEQNIITQGAVVQTYPATPSTPAVVGTIAGGIGEQAGNVLASDASQIPIKQVLIPKGETIGIQFIGPVLSSDDVAPGAVDPQQQKDLTAISQPGGQPTRQQYVFPQQTPAAYTPPAVTTTLPQTVYYPATR